MSDDLFAKQYLLEDEPTVAVALRRYASDFGVPIDNMSVRDALDTLYVRLRLLYPAEFVLKNELLNRIFLARHNPSKATVLTEMRVGQNRVDLVAVNGTTTAYEVKSRFDSLARLNAQVSSYLSVFERVYVVCDPKKIERIAHVVDPTVGIMVTNAAGGFRTIRKAAASARLDHAAMFDCLRKPEYQAIARRRFGTLPVVPNMFERASYLEMFRTLPMRALQSDFAAVLRLRGMHPHDAAAMQDLPYSMRLRYYELSKSDRWMVKHWWQ
jgi:hypothetical protein